MLNKMNSAYLCVTNFFRNLKKDERGLSGVVVAVLLILVAVLAIVLLWSLLGAQIQTWWDQIVNGASGGLTPQAT